MGESFGVDLVSLVRGSGQTRWVSADLPPVPLPMLEVAELVHDAHTTLRYARHPVVCAGVSSLIGVPLPVGTLWLGAKASHAFNERTFEKLTRWGQLLDRLHVPSDDGTIYKRFIAMMAAPAMYLNGESVFVNRAFELLTGYRADEVATLDAWFERLYEHDAPTVRAMYELDRQHQFTSSRVSSVRRKDGSDRLVEFSARREGPHEVWLLHDATERVASQERFRVLFEQSSTALSIYDEQGLIDCNPAAIALLGYGTKAEVLHLRPFELSPPSQPCGQPSRDVLARMENIALTQGSHRFDWVYRTVSGPDAQVEITLTPLMLGARRVLLAEWHDISERLRYEQGLEAARDSALAYAKARSDFLATMSHEIRTPMNGVIGMTQLLGETALSEQQREYVETVRACGDGLLALINDILDFSKLEAGKVQLESIPFSVRELAEDAVSVVASQAHGKHLELTCGIDSEVPAVVWGDPTRMRQVLLNLLSNAVKFTAKGSVEMRVKARAVGPEGAAELEFVVRDSGIGIAPEALPRLFSAFSQEDGSTTRRFGGSGLGLVICKGLTELMRGAIDVKSSPEGSTFKVSLPLRVHTQSSARPRLHGHTVAVLEQRAVTREVLVAQLAATGLTVITPDDEHGLGAAEVVLIGQGFQGERGAAIAAQGRSVGLLRRLDGSVLDESFAAFVLPTPVREFRLHLQLERLLSRREPENPRALAPPHRQFNARVLVAEDNRINQRVVKGLLEKLGCTVTIVDNGLQAVEALRDAKFELVLMDCQMPELDGLAATQQIRQRQLQHVPIIALTAGVMDGDRERCLAAGMDEFLHKPVRLEDLTRALSTWLPAPAL